MRRAIKSLLRKIAHELYECADGEAAIEAYARLRPDWLVMDIEVPVVDGVTATRRILAAFPAASIVLVTSFDDARLRAAAIDAGARAYLLKDDLTDLGAMVQSGAAEQE